MIDFNKDDILNPDLFMLKEALKEVEDELNFRNNGQPDNLLGYVRSVILNDFGKAHEYLKAMNKDNVEATGATWKINTAITTRVSIDNFEDPLYVIKSFGRVTNAIVKSPITDFVNGNDVTNLRIHLNNSYYIASNLSPNYLMRLRGDLGNSSTGIESLVNLDEFIEQGLSINDRSAVDYIYFGTQSTTNYRINKTPSWFKLDEDHLEIYEAQDVKCVSGDICVTD